jgi:hypothetical protein
VQRDKAAVVRVVGHNSLAGLTGLVWAKGSFTLMRLELERGVVTMLWHCSPAPF